MARRIVLTVLSLVGALLITAVIPLGLLTTARERDSFRQDTVLSARADAALAEDGLTESDGDQAMAMALARARLAGEAAWVYNSRGHLVAHAFPAHDMVPAPPATIAYVLRHSQTLVSQNQGQLRVATQVQTGTGQPPVGVLVLARPTTELNERLWALWAWLSAIAAVGLLAGAIVAVGFARWVGRPLSALDEAAQRIGDDALDTRSVAGQGPPEVRRLAATFNTMAGRLEALVHGHQASMADVSHQLRTPLAALRLRLDVLAQDADADTATELADAQEEIARLSRMVDGLLAVARAENVVTEPVTVAVAEVIKDRVAAWAPVADERGITLTTSGPALARASLGEGHLEQILDNLLANALDAVPAGGNVWVRINPDGPGIQIVVADDGPGMSQVQRDTAFHRFASGTTGGTGLGLAIVYRLVNSNGGAAHLSDTLGGGLTVTLSLPGAQPGQARLPADGSAGRMTIPYQS